MSPIAACSAPSVVPPSATSPRPSWRPARDDLRPHGSAGESRAGERADGPTVELHTLRAHLREGGDARLPTEPVVPRAAGRVRRLVRHLEVPGCAVARRCGDECVEARAEDEHRGHAEHPEHRADRGRAHRDGGAAPPALQRQPQAVAEGRRGAGRRGACGDGRRPVRGRPIASRPSRTDRRREPRSPRPPRPSPRSPRRRPPSPRARRHRGRHAGPHPVGRVATVPRHRRRRRRLRRARRRARRPCPSGSSARRVQPNSRDAIEVVGQSGDLAGHDDGDRDQTGDRDHRRRDPQRERDDVDGVARPLRLDREALGDEQRGAEDVPGAGDDRGNVVPCRARSGPGCGRRTRRCDRRTRVRTPGSARGARRTRPARRDPGGAARCRPRGA